MLCRIASAGKIKKHADRNLRRCIHKAGVSLPVEIETVKTTIQLRKPKVRVVEMYWPTLSMKSWIATLLKSYPELMLGGFKLEQKTEWQELFRYFWRAYKEVDETHPVFHELPIEALSTAIPIMVHGDEGRGLRSQAFMVQSFQFVISHLGPYVTNTSGQLICSWSSFDVDIG